jgi:hypothetical protein
MTGNKIKVPVGIDRRSGALTSKTRNSVAVNDLAILGVSRRENSSCPDQVNNPIVKKRGRNFWDITVY